MTKFLLSLKMMRDHNDKIRDVLTELESRYSANPEQEVSRHDFRRLMELAMKLSVIPAALAEVDGITYGDMGREIINDSNTDSWGDAVLDEFEHLCRENGLSVSSETEPEPETDAADVISSDVFKTHPTNWQGSLE